MLRWLFGPKRNSKHITSKFEEKCRVILENHYGVKFKPIRPNWLKNPKTNSNLELDGYNKKLKIAFEANGIQHYKYDSHFHSSRQDFIDQQYRDRLKAKLCKKKGIHLIVIPYHTKNIKKYIISHLP